MTAVGPELYLYNLTLQRPSSAIRCCIGSFIGTKSKQQEIVRATATSIELWTFDKHTGTLRKVSDQHTYSHLRNIQTVRVGGGTSTDSLLVTSDSGNLCVLQWDEQLGRFARVVSEPYFKTGLRTITPGEFVAVDGKCRAFMLGAIQKNKFVYTIGTDHADGTKAVVSSPLTANQPSIVTFDLCALDIGYDDPLFAAIESDASTQPFKKSLTYYELDLGLNHVVRKYFEEVPETSSFLIPLPGASAGPSGVLVCSSGLIQYRYMSKMIHSVPIPRRKDDDKRAAAVSIVAGVVHVLKHSFFVLLQTSLGDLFKITVECKSQEDSGAGGDVESISIRYFDTIPLCRSLLIFKSGFLYANSESGDQYIYQFDKLGDDPSYKSWVSRDYPDEVSALNDPTAVFSTRGFDNLNLVYIVENLNPLVGSTLYDSGNVSDLPVVLSLCGSGARSSLRIINHELAYSEIVAQELPSKVHAVFATRIHSADAYDKFIVLSFYDSTLLLSVGEDVEEAENTGFNTDERTINVGSIGSHSVVQIHPTGFRQIFYGNDDRPSSTVKWEPPMGIQILHSACTSTQVVLALSNREIVYFETDGVGKLIEYTEHKELDAQITSVSLGVSSSARFPYIIAGTKDQALTILKTDPSATLELVDKQDLSSVPVSLAAYPMTTENDSSALFLHIGMSNGVYARLRFDEATGELSAPRNQYTGPNEVKLSKLNFAGQNVIGISSSRFYLGYQGPTDFQVTALKKPAFSGMCSFKSEDVPVNGALGISNDILTILTVDQLDSNISMESIGLRYTPKDMTDLTDDDKMVYIAESDNGVASPYEEGVSYEIDEELQEKYQQFGYPGASSCQWSSCLQVVSYENKAVGQTIELSGAAAFKTCITTFGLRAQKYLVVSTAAGQQFAPNRNEGTYLRVYKIEDDGSLEFLHETKTEFLVLCMTPFQGKLLVGMQNVLILYDLGKKQLLRKCAARLDCRQITDIGTQGFRIVAGDGRDSVRLIAYKPDTNTMIQFADDIIPRATTRVLMLDYDTVLVGDKFGSLSVLRCPPEASQISDEDAHGTLLGNKRPKLNGAPFRLEPLMSFYTADVPTSFQRGSLSVGGSECIVYTGLQGTIGCLHPLQKSKEVNFFRELQKQISREHESLTDREWIKFRSYYVPIKGCIDGDLIEEYFHLSGEKRLRIAKLMEREAYEIDRRISEMRMRFAY